MVMVTSNDRRPELLHRTARLSFVSTVNRCSFSGDRFQRQWEHRLSFNSSRKIYSTSSSTIANLGNDSPKSPRISFDYCTGCRWGLRAGWMAQELLQTFGTALGEVAIRPSDNSGTFNVWLDGQLIWCRKREGGFPELKELKQRVRDVIDPQMSLGHSDKAQEKPST